jgi:hypothetical protein
MAESFDIRFSRAAGFAALLEAPANTFRWTGRGQLSIDAQGISVALQRGLSSWPVRNRARRIAAADLRQVFREGEALRVEFSSSGAPRASMQFWAKDRATAAQIVSLLPTLRTVELEEGAAAGQFRVNRPVATLLGIALAAITCGIVVMRFGHSPPVASAMDTRKASPTSAAAAPVTAGEPARADSLEVARTTTPAGAASEPATRPSTRTRLHEGAAPPAAGAPGDAIGETSVEPENGDLLPAFPATELSLLADIPLPARAPLRVDGPLATIPSNTPAWNEALRQLALFGSDLDDLREGLERDRQLFESARISRAEMAKRVDAYEDRWWDVTFRILDTDAFAVPVLADLRATLLASARYQRHFLALYAEGVRTANQATLRRALVEQARADALHKRARRFID